jgi:glutamyl-tRNA reductase
VAALKQRLTEVCDAEFLRQRKHLGALTPEQELAIRQNLLGAIVNKIMHPMILGLRESVQQTGDADTVDLRRAFDLDTVVLPENKPERLPEPTDIPDDPPVTFSSKRR